jgi:phosphatidylinositol-3-phosphatase
MYLVNTANFRSRFALSLLGFALAALSNYSASAAMPPKVGHVFVIVLENEGYDATFGPTSPARYLNGLRSQGALLQSYYGIGHHSLDNYIAMISGQGPNFVTQGDCPKYIDFSETSVGPFGQAIGSGCVYPKTVHTIADELQTASLTWKGYMEDMGNDLKRDRSATCSHPELGDADGTQIAEAKDQYAARHNPFVYFHSIIDASACDANVVNLSELPSALASVKTTPNYAFVVPNLCHDGHDGGDGRHRNDGIEPGGLISADQFLAQWVPKILRSAAFKQDGLIVITFDESDSDDATVCCEEQHGPNISPNQLVFKKPDMGPGVTGPGGGRIGALLLSPFINPGTVSTTPYNHYSLLKSLEDNFGLPPLGYASQPNLVGFGEDVFTNTK